MSTASLPFTGETFAAAGLEEPRSTIRLGTRLIFAGKPGAFLKILATGALLQIPTFGFYRFWLITRLRRHLWANTRLGSDPFEYTGTGKELLIGFLIAMAVLVPIYIACALLGFIAESVWPMRWAMSLIAMGCASSSRPVERRSCWACSSVTSEAAGP
jgi:uncharacterized membrane protein YjgN (DUF898 family)